MERWVSDVASTHRPSLHPPAPATPSKAPPSTPPCSPAGFPGAVNCTVTYTLLEGAGEDESGRLEYRVSAVTDKPTPVSVYLHP